jgi:hypothetical protein
LNFGCGKTVDQGSLMTSVAEFGFGRGTGHGGREGEKTTKGWRLFLQTGAEKVEPKFRLLIPRGQFLYERNMDYRKEMYSILRCE